MKNVKLLLSLLVGLAAGALLGVYFDGNGPATVVSGPHEPPSPSAAARPPLQGEDLSKELAAALAENDRLRARVAELEQAAAAAEPEAERRQASSFSFSSDRPPTAAQREEMIERMRPHMRRFVESRLDRYRMRLDLDEKQYQALSDLLLLQQEQTHRRMMSMSQPADEQTAPDPISSRDLLDMAADILGPEQHAEYASILQEERASRNEMIATAQLGQLSTVVKMTPEQKDAAYGALYGVADQAGDNPAFLGAPETQEQIQEALGKILNEEQLKSYNEYLKQQGERDGPRAVFMGG